MPDVLMLTFVYVSIRAFSIMTLDTESCLVQCRLCCVGFYAEYLYSECHCAECSYVKNHVIILSVVKLSEL